MQKRGIESLVLALVLAACSTQMLEIAGEPAGARVLLDGQVRGQGVVALPRPYYGTMQVTVMPPQAAGLQRAAARAKLTLEEPVTPWLFPFDFVFELLSRPFRPSGPLHLQIDPGARVSDVTTAVRPARTEELRTRAHRMRTAR